jgi:hypothetical protein
MLYYEDDYVQLWHGDCQEIAGWTGADVLVTDPPYGIDYATTTNRTVTRAQGRAPAPKVAGDHSTDARDAVLQTWGDRPALVFGSWRVPRPAGTRFRLIWDKGEAGMGDLELPWRPGDEEIYVLGHGWRGARGPNVLRVSNVRSDRPNHPTPKPVPLMEALIAKCPPGVIADPFAGSGSTLIAARNLGRKVIGVELEERYCDLIVRRLGQQAFVFDEIAG